MQTVRVLFHHFDGHERFEDWLRCEVAGCERYHSELRGYLTHHEKNISSVSVHICQNDACYNKWLCMGLVRDVDEAIAWYCSQCGRREPIGVAA
jgi:hypothetical protein